MNTTPGTETGDPGRSRRRRLVLVGVVIIVLAIVAAAAGFYYLYGGTAPDAPTIEDALQQLLPTGAPE